MLFSSTQRRPAASRALIAFTVMLLLLAFNPAIASAQSQLCTNCTLYARTELNLRQGPSLNAAVLRFIPAGAAVHRTTGAESNGYAPVTYDGVSGWAVALGFVATPAEIDAAAAPSAPATAPATTTTSTSTSTTTSETRFTLAPLMLRSGPAVDDEPVLVIPEGARLTLTQQGAENGYVTVDYDGVTGWVYADLIARQDELR
jgi:zinc D-Ala-D-Ala carboxypeptidase